MAGKGGSEVKVTKLITSVVTSLDLTNVGQAFIDYDTGNEIEATRVTVLPSLGLTVAALGADPAPSLSANRHERRAMAAKSRKGI